MNEIRRKLPVTELLAGLAEESCELAQSALKLRRVFDKTNYTPMDEDDAINGLYEEIADVQLYLGMIDYSQDMIDEIKKRKLKRWKERLGIM